MGKIGSGSKNGGVHPGVTSGGVSKSERDDELISSSPRDPGAEDLFEKVEPPRGRNVASESRSGADGLSLGRSRVKGGPDLGGTDQGSLSAKNEFIDGRSGGDSDYRILRVLGSLKGPQVIFQVLVGDRSFDISCGGPVSSAELEEVAENVAKTALRLSGAGIEDFQRAKFKPNGDVDVHKPVIGLEGLLGKELERVTGSTETKGKVDALFLRADGTVAVAGSHLSNGIEKDLSEKDGKLSRLAKEVAKTVAKSAVGGESTLVGGFEAGQLSHITDSTKQTDEERLSLSYTRLDSILTNSGASLAKDPSDEVYGDFIAFLGETLGVERGDSDQMRGHALAEARRLVAMLPGKPLPYVESELDKGGDKRGRLDYEIEQQANAIWAKQAHLLIASAGVLKWEGMEVDLKVLAVNPSSAGGFSALADFVAYYEGEERTHLGAASEGFWEKSWKMLQLRESLLALGGE